MKIAFYRANTGDWSDKLISWWTDGPYSHCEIVFDDGMFFSSSARDNGVRFKKVDPYPGHWDFVELPTWGDEAAMLAAAKKEVGKKYDWLGLIGFVLPVPFFHSNYHSWFCSEICMYLLVKGGIMPSSVKPWHYTPNGFYNRVVHISNCTKEIRDFYERLRNGSPESTEGTAQKI